MSCLEISMPRLDGAVKEKLARELTDAFVKASGFPGDIFNIFFMEYGKGDVASGGRMRSPDDERPYIHFLLYCPRINWNTKKKLAAAFSEAFEKTVDNPDWDPVIHFCDILTTIS